MHQGLDTSFHGIQVLAFLPNTAYRHYGLKCVLFRLMLCLYNLAFHVYQNFVSMISKSYYSGSC